MTNDTTEYKMQLIEEQDELIQRLAEITYELEHITFQENISKED